MAPDTSHLPAHLAANPFQDLSGVDTSKFANPYDALLEATENDPRKLQERYQTHRVSRNAQQKEKLLSKDFTGLNIDPILKQLEDGKSVKELGYVDPRHCLVFWGRPEEHIKRLIGEVQQRLRAAVPNLWLMPRDNLHITILEITHSKTFEEIEVLKKQIAPVAQQVADYPLQADKKARLIKPMIGFDASAIALSFVPAAGENDEFSYHHLRRDSFGVLTGAGMKVDSRYVVPSAHLTIGRFLEEKDFMQEDGSLDQEKIAALVTAIEETNEWLQKEFWVDETKGGWTVGEGEGIVLRWGTVWYGGGETMVQTKRG